MTTSNTYTFQNTPLDEILRECFERCGVTAQIVSGEQVKSLIASANYMLVNWGNDGLNLSTIETHILSQVKGKSDYGLPVGTYDIIGNELNSTTSLRQLNGTPAASSGNAANAFDGDSTTACTQAAPDGNISYDFGANVTKNINYVGILTNSVNTYTIQIQYSLDNVNWVNLNIPQAQSYQLNDIVWFFTNDSKNINYGTPARYWRIVETGGATLDIQELYFNTNSQSRQVQRIPRDQWFMTANKYTESVASSFWVDRTINPKFTVYPIPNGSEDLFVFNIQRNFQDIRRLTETAPVPQRWLEALVSGMAYRLAKKFYPDHIERNKEDSIIAYQLAKQYDVDQSPIKINFFHS